MQLKFNTDSVSHARAALILYAMYKSRDKNSALNGVETWNRFGNFMRAASLKSTTTAEFVQEFCHKAKIQSIKPRYLGTDDPVIMPETGELILSDSVKDYKLDILEDNTLLKLFERESQYLIILVRERIQREKIEGVTDDEEIED